MRLSLMTVTLWVKQAHFFLHPTHHKLPQSLNFLDQKQGGSISNALPRMIWLMQRLQPSNREETTVRAGHIGAQGPGMSAGRDTPKVASVVSDSAAPWTVARQAPLSMEFSRQEYWIGLPFPSPRYLPDPGTMVQPGINLSGNLEEFTYFCFLSEKTGMIETEQQ